MKKIYEDIKKVFESKILVGFLYGIGAIVLVALIFSAGVAVGFHKASFGRAWGENYERNFGMRPGRMMFGDDNFPNPHGSIGKIIKIELPTITTEDNDGTEKAVLIGSDTKIEKAREPLQPADLKTGDFVVVIGNPNDQGQIEAKLIRIMPFPELMGWPGADQNNPAPAK